MHLSRFFCRVKPLQSLFNGLVKMSTNMSDADEISHGHSQQQCLVQPSGGDQCDTNVEGLAGSDDLNRREMILPALLQIGANKDLSLYTRLDVEEENELEDDDEEDPNADLLTGLRSNSVRVRAPSLSEITFSAGPPSKEPEDGKLKLFVCLFECKRRRKLRSNFPTERSEFIILRFRDKTNSNFCIGDKKRQKK
jgi:hypothetical protein